MLNSHLNILILIALFSLFLGWLFFHLLLRVLKTIGTNQAKNQRTEILNEAKKQGQLILETKKNQAKEHEALAFEDLDENILEIKEEHEGEEKELKEQEETLLAEEKRIEQLSSKMDQEKQTLAEEQVLIEKKSFELLERQEKLSVLLAEHCQTKPQDILEDLIKEKTEEAQINAQKYLRLFQDSLKTRGQRNAKEFLARVHSRYTPYFVWPRHSNIVELPNKALSDRPKLEQVLSELAELSETTADIVEPKSEDSPFLVRFRGGGGIYREAARLSLETLLEKSKSTWSESRRFYEKFFKRLDEESIQLGAKAISILGLPDIHPEIQKLVGQLNWRTSYRQNQWYHTLEVATLAGILGAEFGVDIQDSKRVGLLHDIGKAIDYRIEGSHAVISGDYADRYGEKRYICDAVMSHHADLIVETPLAFILQTADTLSGGRPGARVNLEEGYQTRLDAISDIAQSFPGIIDVSIMSGGREVRIKIDHQRVSEKEAKNLVKKVASRIEEEVAYPGQIKVHASRTFEAISLA